MGRFFRVRSLALHLAASMACTAASAATWVYVSNTSGPRNFPYEKSVCPSFVT